MRTMSNITYIASDKECPSCGQRSITLIAYKDGHNASQVIVRCDGCGSMTDTANNEPNGKIGLKEVTSPEMIEKLDSKWTRKRG